MRTLPRALIGMILSGLLGSGLLVSGLPFSAAIGDEAVSDRWGSAAEGLRMSLSIVGKDETGGPEFQVALENVGRRDVTLNLGMMLANGKPLTGTALFPTNVRIELTDVAGTTRELHLAEPNVAGRVDDYLVQLRVGSTYTLKVPLNKYWCPADGEVPLKLKPGEVQASARFHGVGAQQESGEFVLNYWEGTVRSNAVPLKR